MDILTLSEIDLELVSWTNQIGDLSTTLLGLDSHPGLEHLRRYPLTGTTAARWEVIGPALGQLWDDLAAMTSTLQAVEARRGRRFKRDDDRVELTRLLRNGGLADARDSIRAACCRVGEFLDAVEAIDVKIAHGVAPLLRRLDAAGWSTPQEIIDLLTVSAADPLSFTAPDIDHRIATISELITLRATWPEAIAWTHGRLNDLRDATSLARQAHGDAERVVVAGFAAVTDPEPALRDELLSMTEPDPTALRSLQRRIESGLQVVLHHQELAQGLLERRAELKGRLEAYAAKAARLGLAEDPELSSSHQIALGLLSRRPCDLRAVTRAVADYQQLVSGKRGAMR